MSKLKKRIVQYWLICAGKQHDGNKSTGTIAPGVEHYHQADPYLVRCASCAQKDGLLK